MKKSVYIFGVAMLSLTLIAPDKGFAGPEENEKEKISDSKKGDLEKGKLEESKSDHKEKNSENGKTEKKKKETMAHKKRRLKKKRLEKKGEASNEESGVDEFSEEESSQKKHRKHKKHSRRKKTSKDGDGKQNLKIERGKEEKSGDQQNNASEIALPTANQQISAFVERDDFENSGIVAEPIIDSSKFESNSVKIEEQPMTRLANNIRKIKFPASNQIKMMEIPDQIVVSKNVDDELRKISEKISMRTCNNRNIETEIGKKCEGTRLSNAKLTWYRINSKETIKLRQELEKYNQIYAGKETDGMKNNPVREQMEKS